MSIKTKYLLGAILIAILLLFGSGWYLGRKHTKDALNPVLNAFTDTIRQYVVEIGNHKVYIAEKEQEVKTLKEALKQNNVQREELRKLNAKYVNELTRLKITIDTLMNDVPHNGQIITVHDTITINNGKKALLLPFTFLKMDEWMRLGGTFDSEGKLGINLKVNANLDIWAVQKKRNAKPVVLITTQNPYINVISVQSIKLDTPKDRKWGIGVVGAYGINVLGSVKASPFIGVGLAYTPIRF